MALNQRDGNQPDPDGRAPTGRDLTGRDLTERDRTILDIEARWWTGGGSRAALVREHLGLSMTRYHEILDLLVDDPAAEAYDPLLVRRLRRHRDRRRRARRNPTLAETSSR